MIDVTVVWPAATIEKSLSTIEKWKAQGYRVCVLVNPPHTRVDFSQADVVIVQNRWEGFAVASNILCREVPGDIVVVAGDDMLPDPKKGAQEIGEDFHQRFPDLFGVMQPTGDRYGCIDKCAVSPWIGRVFIEKAYGGKGPYWEGYFHYFADEELQAMATQLGAFYQRPDISQYHDHWQRREGIKRPSYLVEALHKHATDGKLFRSRRVAKFPTLKKLVPPI